MVRYNVLQVFVLAVFLYSCNQDQTNQTNEQKSLEQNTVEKKAYQKISPNFDEKAAYDFVKKQVDFGPRVTNSAAHKKCGDWLVAELKKYCTQVSEQKTVITNFDGQKLKVRNIIGEINPQASNRVLLCAHWDSRPYADQDVTKQTEPILGANDGASGVGVLLEIAKVLKSNPINTGIDIVFFDAEDLGKSEHENSYCLGSQYWSANPHKPNYKANFGILLDMVGAPGAKFAWEQVSVEVGEILLQNIWQTAGNLGYSDQFIYFKKAGIIDDHYYINKIAKIPTIDIIHYDAATATGFPSHWHTHQDNMSAIDSKTLKAVGQTLLEVLYNLK